MKKRYSFLLLAIVCTSTLQAQKNCATVQQVSADYKNSKVTFDVYWNDCTGDETNHRNTVWVFVDYQLVNANGMAVGEWGHAPLVNATPTFSNSIPTYTAGNSTGFWLYNTNGKTSRVTVALSIPANSRFKWCAFATDYPPNVTFDNGSYSFKGTTNFIVSPSQTVATKNIKRANLTINTATTFTDATGCPGIGNLYCPYTGDDLFMDLTHLCQQRTSGAKNWEAWIKDARDGVLYRITQFSDNSWWFAGNLATTDKRVAVCSGNSYYSGGDKPNCPTGWSLPTWDEFNTRGYGTYTADSWGASALGSFLAFRYISCFPCTATYVDVGDYLHNGCTNSYAWCESTWNWCPITQATTHCNSYIEYGKIRCFRK